MTNPAVYENLKVQASNLSSQEGNYTKAQFLADFPEFVGENSQTVLPETMIERYVADANKTVSPRVWGSRYLEAAGLFVAHFCALRLQTYASVGSPTATAGNAEQKGVVKSATMGDTSVSYDNTAITSATEKWGTWNATKYGAQFATMARGIGAAGSFIV